MAVFDWAESDRSSIDTTPRVKAVAFGDGYEQRAPDGLNNLAQEFPLSFDDVDNDIGDAIIAFLEARGGYEAFDWTPKWATTAVRVKCPNWSRSIASAVSCNISAKFVRVYEP